MKPRVIIAARRLVLAAGVGGCLLAIGCQHPRREPTAVAHEQNDRFSRLRFPLLEVPEDGAAIAAFRSNPASTQPWMETGRRPPTNLKDIGLSGPLHLALFRRTQSDPAFPILVGDSHGHLFAFCATSETDYNGYGDAFLLGDIRPKRTLLKITPDSEAYRFLFSLVWSFARDARYQCEAATLKNVQERLRLSDDEFAQLLSQPKWSRAQSDR